MVMHAFVLLQQQPARVREAHQVCDGVRLLHHVLLAAAFLLVDELLGMPISLQLLLQMPACLVTVVLLTCECSPAGCRHLCT